MGKKEEQQRREGRVRTLSALMTDADIADIIGCSQSTVSRIRKRLGLKSAGRGRPRTLDPDEEVEVVQRYQAGETVAELAEEFGVSIRPIYSAINRTTTA